MTKGSSDIAYSIILRKISFILTENLFMSEDPVSIGKRCVAIIIFPLEPKVSGLSATVILYGQNPTAPKKC